MASVPTSVEVLMCAVFGPAFSIFWILQIRSEPYARPSCRKTAQVVHRWMLAASLLITSEIPVFYLYMEGKTRLLIFLLRLISNVCSSMYFSCLAMVCYWIVRAFYKSLVAPLPRYTKRLFMGLCLLSIMTAFVPIYGYYGNLTWPNVLPTVANDFTIIGLLLLLTRYWNRAKRLINSVYSPATKQRHLILDVPRSCSEAEIFKHVGTAAVEDDVSEVESQPSDPVNEKEIYGEEKVRFQLRKLGIFIVWIATSMFPVIIVGTLRSLDMLKEDASLEKSSYSFYLLIVGACVLSFCAWYAWIPIVWRRSPMTDTANFLAPSTVVPATGAIDLSYQSLDMTAPPVSSSFSEGTSPNSLSYLGPPFIPTTSNNN